MEELKTPITRTVEVLEGGFWKRVEFLEIEEGDIFRMFEENGDPVDLGEIDEAEADAYIDEQGNAKVRSRRGGRVWDGEGYAPPWAVVPTVSLQETKRSEITGCEDCEFRHHDEKEGWSTCFHPYYSEEGRDLQQLDDEDLKTAPRWCPARIAELEAREENWKEYVDVLIAGERFAMGFLVSHGMDYPKELIKKGADCRRALGIVTPTVKST